MKGGDSAFLRAAFSSDKDKLMEWRNIDAWTWFGECVAAKESAHHKDDCKRRGKNETPELMD